MLNNVNDIISNQLERLQTNQKLKDSDILRRCGFTRPTLAKIKSGGNVNIETLAILAEGLNVPISYFFDEEKESNIVLTTKDHSGSSYHGNVKITHNDHSCCDKKMDINIDEKVAMLEKYIAKLESSIEDKDEIIRLLREKENK